MYPYPGGMDLTGVIMGEPVKIGRRKGVMNR
jgi:hypothetical protein